MGRWLQNRKTVKDDFMKKLNKNNLIVLTAITLCIICMGISYPFIHEEAQNVGNSSNDKQLKEVEILDKIFSSTMPYYYQLKQKETPDIQPYDVFINQEDAQLSTQYAQTITDLITNALDYLNDDYRNVAYYIEDRETNQTIVRGDEKALEALRTNKKSDDFAWYLMYSFDDKGILTIQAYHDLSYSKSFLSNRYKFALENFISSQRSTRLLLKSETSNTYTIEFENLTEFELNPVKNATYLFAINQETLTALILSDALSDTYWANASYGNTMYRYFLMILTIAAVILLVLKFQIHELRFLKTYKRIPLEVHFFIILMLFAFVNDSGWLVKNTLEHTHYFFDGAATSIFDYFVLYILENFLFWFLMFGYCLYLVLSIKDDIQTHTLKIHFLIARIWYSIKQKLQRFWLELQSFNLNYEDDKQLIRLIGINIVILFFMISLWVFGYFFLIIYTIAVFILAKKYLRKVRKDYSTLLDTTKQIAQGNFDSDIQVDLGVFDAFQNDMKEIQLGFKEAVEKEVHSQRMKTELITNVSHDLKTPLTSIITYIDLLKKKDISEAERQKYLDTLDRNSIRLKHLIEDLFEVSKANSGNVKLEKMNMDICSLMKQVQVELNDKLVKKKLVIRNSFSDDKIICYLDPQKMYRIFENLVSNICKYALKNTRVYVEITDFQSYVNVTLRNISADELTFDTNDITERFTRGDSSRNTDGSGLGLAIAKSFTELQGGSLNVHVDGDLFKVTLRFPKKEEQQSEEEGL